MQAGIVSKIFLEIKSFYPKLFSSVLGSKNFYHSKPEGAIEQKFSKALRLPPTSGTILTHNT